jgi:hypothetical protein
MVRCNASGPFIARGMMLTRRQAISAIGLSLFGGAVLHARQEKKDVNLATVTLIVDGMT